MHGKIFPGTRQDYWKAEHCISRVTNVQSRGTVQGWDNHRMSHKYALGMAQVSRD